MKFTKPAFECLKLAWECVTSANAVRPGNENGVRISLLKVCF